MPTSAVAPEIVWLPDRGHAAIDEFGAEGRSAGAARVAEAVDVPSVDVPSAARTAQGRRWFLATAALAALGLLAVVVVAVALLWASRVAPSVAPVGTFVIETLPPGLEVQLDGEVVGTTPLTVTVQAGRRTLRLRHGERERLVTTLVAPGETVRQRFEFLPAPPQATPAAPSKIVAASAEAAARPRPTPASALSGWVHVDVPVPLRIFEAGELVGTTDVDRLMLPVGEHALDLRSDELRFSTHETAVVRAGATTTIQVHLPTARVSINAKPWAEAWVDGQRVGDTPIGNVFKPIGRHEVLLRHPDLGERRVSVLVTLDRPARVSVDLAQSE